MWSSIRWRRVRKSACRTAVPGRSTACCATTACSMPAKFPATSGIAFVRRPATSPWADMSKYCCAAASTALAVGRIDLRAGVAGLRWCAAHQGQQQQSDSQNKTVAILQMGNHSFPVRYRNDAMAESSPRSNPSRPSGVRIGSPERDASARLVPQLMLRPCGRLGLALLLLAGFTVTAQQSLRSRRSPQARTGFVDQDDIGVADARRAQVKSPRQETRACS